MNTPTPPAVYARMTVPQLTMQALAATFGQLPRARLALAWGRLFALSPRSVWRARFCMGPLRLPPIREAA